ncbi:MAG: hypothetical protein LBG61_04900, partial [Burkholderiales bacterium]|nr:hypothetical protein [Burkholderiales bacterium]
MSFIRKTGIALLVAAVACFLFSIFAVLVTRFYVLPYCGQNPHLVTNLLARQIGQPVTIGSLTVGWDGWNPELIIKDLRVYDPVVNYHEADLGELVPQIDLPDVTMLVSWQSLFYRDVRFKKLLINAPRLVIRRNADNQIIVGGSVISAKAGKNAQDSGFTLTEWLRRQSSMEITKGSVDWIDEKRQAPPLRVRDFSLVGRRNAMTFSGVFHTHQTDGTSDDAASAAPAEPPISFHVQGQPISRLLNPNHAWRWIFRVKDVDFKDLTQWFDFPFNVKSGKGQFENSVTVVQREITNFTLDIQLTDAAVRLLPDEWGTTDAEKENAAELPLLHFKEASGRLTGKREIVETSGDTALARYTIAARNFTFLSGNGSLLPPSDVTLIIKTDQTVKTVDWLSALSSAQEASLSFKHLQLQPLFEVLEGLPLPQAFRTAFAESHYQGALDNGSFTVTQRNRESDISGAVDLVNISGNPSGDVPGVKNLSGHLVFAPHGGQFTINTKSGELHLPTIFAEPLPIDGFDGNVSWQWERYRLTGLTFEKLHVQNDDLEGTVDGTWRADDHWGVIDLKGNITRAKATGAYRYIPNIVGHRVRDWLRDALLAGNADHASLALQGELRHFPFDEAPETGIFSITAHVTGGTLQYQPDWMPIHEIEADLSFQNATMTITAQKGQVDTARVTDAVVAVQKLNAEFPHLTVKGNAEGDLSAYLNFVAQTPVKEKMDHLLDDAKGQGSVALNLTLDIPLSLEDEATTIINGRLRLSDAALLLPDVPPMSHINGVATFTDKEVAAPQLKFNVLGGDAVAQLNNVKDGILFQSQGTFDAGTLKEVYGWTGFTHVSGSSTWAIKVTRTARLSEWTISSPMTGIAIDLPAPMNKPAGLEAPLRIRRAQGKQDIWYVDYHADEFPLAWVALQERVKDQWQLSRAAVTLGGTEVGLPANNQIVVHATMPAFHVNEWYRLYEQLAGNQEDSYLESLSIPIRFDLVSPEVVLREGVIHDAKIIAQTSGTGSELCRSHPVSCWRFNVDGNEIAGTFEWENALASGTKNGKLQAALSKLYLPKIKSTEAQDTDRSQA